MKTRNGFVSNSSSSSFVIAFEEKPTHPYDVVEAMFPRQKDGKIEGVSGLYGEDGVDALSAGKLVWDQIANQEPLTKKQIAEEIRSGYFEGYPSLDYSSHSDPSWHVSREYNKRTGKNIHDKDADPVWKKKYDDALTKHYKEQQKAVDEAAKKYLEKVYPKFKGKKCFRVSFSDNDGSVFSTMEHGNTFRNLTHIQISHH